MFSFLFCTACAQMKKFFGGLCVMCSLSIQAQRRTALTDVAIFFLLRRIFLCNALLLLTEPEEDFSLERKEEVCSVYHFVPSYIISYILQNLSCFLLRDCYVLLKHL